MERTGGTTGEVNFAGTVTSSATDDADYVGGNPEVFAGIIPEGETSITVTVEVAGDTTVEPDEAFTLTLTAASNADSVPTSVDAGASVATGTIVNDDSSEVIIGGIKILDEAQSLAGSQTTPTADNSISFEVP